MRTTSAKELEAILQLDAPSRFKHFVKRVVDEEQAWGLWNDGWALMQDAEGTSVFPLWPAPEYAQRCAVDVWSEYSPEAVPLAELLSELLPKLQQRGIRPTIFPTPAGKGAVPVLAELVEALRAEMGNYESDDR